MKKGSTCDTARREILRRMVALSNRKSFHRRFWVPVRGGSIAARLQTRPYLKPRGVNISGREVRSRADRNLPELAVASSDHRRTCWQPRCGAHFSLSWPATVTNCAGRACKNIYCEVCPTVEHVLSYFPPLALLDLGNRRVPKIDVMPASQEWGSCGRLEHELRSRFYLLIIRTLDVYVYEATAPLK